MWKSSLCCPVTLLNLTIKERKTRSAAKHTLVVRLPVQQTDQNAFFSDLHTTSQCLKKVHALLIHLSPPWKILTAAPWKTAPEKTTIFFLLFLFFLRRGVHMSCLLNLKRLVRTWPGRRQLVSSWVRMLHTLSDGILRDTSQKHCAPTLGAAGRQHKVMYFTNNGSNIRLLLTPVWLRVEFPFQMTCPQDEALAATLKAEGG